MVVIHGRKEGTVEFIINRMVKNLPTQTAPDTRIVESSECALESWM